MFYSLLFLIKNIKSNSNSLSRHSKWLWKRFCMLLSGQSSCKMQYWQCENIVKWPTNSPLLYDTHNRPVLQFSLIYFSILRMVIKWMLECTIIKMWRVRRVALKNINSIINIFYWIINNGYQLKHWINSSGWTFTSSTWWNTRFGSIHTDYFKPFSNRMPCFE